MRPYSLDLRQRVAAALDQHEGSWRDIARRFGVSLSFIKGLIQRRHETGSIQPKPHGGGHPPALNEETRQRLRQALQQTPDATLAELRSRLGLSCSLMAIWRTLKRLRITRKKKVPKHDEQDRPDVHEQRRLFTATVATMAPEHLVFIDESGAHTAMTRTYGRAPVGERVSGVVPGHWETLTMLAGLRLSGVVAPWVFPGATDSAAFETYVSQVLVPELRPGDVVIWDNLKPHLSAAAVAAVEQAGAVVQPLPPHSPDLTPIEEMWSKVKGVLRKLAERTIPRLIEGVGQALRMVLPQDILGWFRSCGLGPVQT